MAGGALCRGFFLLPLAALHGVAGVFLIRKGSVMSESVKSGLFYGVASWAVITLVLAGCGLSAAMVVPTAEVPEPGEAVGLTPGEHITHDELVGAYEEWQAQVAAEAKKWETAGERSAKWVGVIDGVVFGTFEWASSDEGLALLGAVPGGALIGVLAGYMKRRRGDLTPEEGDMVWDEAYAQAKADGKKLVKSALELAKSHDEKEIANILEEYLRDD
jgi:hypothetical protein